MVATVATFLVWVMSASTVTGSRIGHEPIEPRDGQVLDDFLTVKLRWTPLERSPVPELGQVRLIVSDSSDLSHAIVDQRLPGAVNEFRLAVRPNTKYQWQVISEASPTTPELGFRATFTTGMPRIEAAVDDNVRYRNPRPGAHYLQMQPVKPGEQEPLSPWYALKQYGKAAPPTFEQARPKLPEPVWEGHSDALDAYWYAWKVLCEVWSYAPRDPDHQAVSNLIGIPSWGLWGSTMILDTAFITYFAKYGHAAYPFIEGFDNCYARQHENGFICRESDRENREVYVIFPVNPPLLAWAEWEYYRVSADVRRLQAVFLPIVKHYEWWMLYQRRENGLYWTNGAQEADDSPRNTLMHYAVSATSYQALAALSLSKIAREIGRQDLAVWFEQEHRQLGELVNRHFWDAEHRIYNDLTRDERFITELEPGKRCKHGHMFWPMLAQIAPRERIDGMVSELRNSESFFRRNGVPSLSADSAGYTGGPAGTGQYWRGAVWPPIQCMVQQGLSANDRWELARQLAEKYSAAVVETYMRQRDITENLAPDQPLACGVGKFVGWGGIGPVANLIEYVLGFQLESPNKRLTWRITCPERHGVKNLAIGEFAADLIADARGEATAPRRIRVTSGGDFTLVVVLGEKQLEKKVFRGSHDWTIP